MLILNVWFAKAVILTGMIVTVAIRRRTGARSRSVKVVKSRKGPLEVVLLSLVSIGFLIPLVWIASPWLRFADYPLRFVPFVAVTAFLTVGLWYFWRSHADSGQTGRSRSRYVRSTSWSRPVSTHVFVIRCTQRCCFTQQAKYS